MQVATSIGHRIKNAIRPALRPDFESTDPQEAYKLMAELISGCRRELQIYGWDPEVDDREGMSYAFRSAMMRQTSVPFGGTIQLQIRAIFQNNKTPKIMSTLAREYKDRILIRELEKLNCCPFKIIDAGALDEYSVEIIYPPEKDILKRQIFRGKPDSMRSLAIAKLAGDFEKDYFNKYLYS